ncbi:hypothetical protein [Bacillus sp. EB600]|uniref:hypothetical protein n=1 Tax=Bacillus sp. EB600 TaxID=2806345 RepID=UPI00210DC1DC|nr:hypothetical protein [Bacillus sp. EB600]MCQ6282007.1 hypothetical protein [Bacillus sp. EB600]
MEKREIQSKKGLYSIISLIILVFIGIGSYFFLLSLNPGVKHIGTKPKYLNQVGLSPNSLKSLVSLEGPVNLTEFLQRMGGYKKVFGNDKKVWVEASPETYAANKQLPPMLLVTRRKSTIAAFVDKTRIAGNTANIFECKTLSHSEVTQLIGSTKGTEEAKKMTKAVAEFFKKYNL